MRILFVLKQMLFVRHFDDVVRLLADRGHKIRIACQNDALDLPPLLQGHKRISTTACPLYRDDEWHVPAAIVRRTRDYLRYIEPEFANARALRARAFDAVLDTVSAKERVGNPQWSEIWLGLTTAERTRLGTTLKLLESRLPTAPAIDAFIAAERPDLVMATPVVLLGSSQCEYLQSARAAGIPTVLPVFSWDNLSNKGVLHAHADATMVWNEIQRREAVEFHGVAPESIAIVGAPRFDGFFRMRPSADRAVFYSQLRLDPGRPTIVYLCSSPTIAPREVEFVLGWVAAIRRSSDSRLASANIIIRPHPRHVGQWTSLRVGGVEGVAVCTTKLDNSDQLLYDSLYHSEAVVGLNTSAQIEAAIVGKPVYTLLAPEFVDGQEGTLHFHYLLKEHGGPVVVARDMDEHLRHLSGAVAGDFDANAIARFVQSFVRPRGLDVPVAPLMADAIETLMEQWRQKARANRPRPTLLERIARRVLPVPVDPKTVGKATAPVQASVAPPERKPKHLDSSTAPAKVKIKDRHRQLPEQAGSATAAKEKAKIKTAEPSAPPDPELKRLTVRSNKSGVVSEKRRARSIVPLDYTRRSLYIYGTSASERNWRAHTCAREPWAVAWLEAHLRPGDVFFDVGAGIGVFSLIGATLCQPGQVVAFEPRFSSYARLCDNVILNGLTNVTPVPLPLAGSAAPMRFSFRTLHAGQSRHTVEAELAAEGATPLTEAPFVQSAFALGLDEVRDRFNLPAPTCLRVGVDDGARGVLMGAGRTLRDPGLASLLVEIGPADGDAVCALLADAGFGLERRHDADGSGEATWHGVFERRP